MNFNSIFRRQNRILLAELVRTDFKLRYENSFLGYVWSVLYPLLLFGVLYLVFAVILKVGRGVENFPVYLLTGIVLYRFFNESTKSGLKAIVQRGALIRKINFPRYIVVISGTISALINLVINLLVVVVFALVSGVSISPSALLIIFPIIELYILALGVAFLLSTINVFLRDMENIWEVVLQAGLYATPIIYPLVLVAESNELVAKLLILNPIAQIIQDVRFLLVTDQTLTIRDFYGGVAQFIPLAIVGVIVWLGVWAFKSKSGTFAERV